MSAIDAIELAAWRSRVDRLTAKCQGFDPSRIGNILAVGKRLFDEAGIKKRLAEVAWLMDVSIPSTGVGGEQCEKLFAVAVTRTKDGLPPLVFDPSANAYRPRQ